MRIHVATDPERHGRNPPRQQASSRQRPHPPPTPASHRQTNRLPSGTIPANYATALAFAPDGRLFWTQRSGTVRVWQNGASKVFATVRTVTTERNGSYSERGLLGLAISPTFTTDRFVYAFYSDANYTTQHVIRWYDCDGTGMDADDHRHASRREMTAATRVVASRSDRTASST